MAPERCFGDVIVDFNEYQRESRKTAIYPGIGKNYIYPALGLGGEAGEVLEKVKKVIRDKRGVMEKADRMELLKELGDVLWYLSNLSTELGLSLELVARENIRKLSQRQKENKLHGSGSSR